MKHDLPVGNVLRQAAHAMDMVSGAYILVLGYLKDFVSDRLPKTIISLLQLLQIRPTLNAAHITL